MKNYVLSLMALAVLTLVACEKPEKTEKTETAEKVETPDYAAFNKKVEVLRSFFKAHGNEDLEAQRAMLSDTLQWSPPAYNGNKWLGKEELLTALKGYQDNFENIKFTEGIVLRDSTVSGVYSGSVFPKETASSTPDAIRLYGTWTATHTETQKPIGVKWYGIGWVNDDGKIAMFTDYFDVNGLAAQLAEQKEE